MRFKTHIHLVPVLMAAVLSSSCTKEVDAEPQSAAEKEVVFQYKLSSSQQNSSSHSIDDGFKASAYTLSSDNIYRNTWQNVITTLSGDIFHTGKYWPSSNPSYKFAAVSLEGRSADTTPYFVDCSWSQKSIVLTFKPNHGNDVDYVVAYCMSPSYKQTNALEFKHCKTKIASAQYNAPATYTITSMTATFQPPIISSGYGEYTMVEQSGGTQWTGWAYSTALTYGSAVSIDSGVVFYPGQITVTLNYTLKKDLWQQSYTKTVPVSLNLYQGKAVNLIFNLPVPSDPAQEITFSTNVVDWPVEQQTIYLTI